MTGPGVPSAGEARRAAALAATHEWFEANSGWAPPDPETLADWAVEGGGRAPDECWVEGRGRCRHGLVPWAVVLDDLDRRDRADARARDAARARRRGGAPDTV